MAVTCVTMDVTDLDRVAALPGALLPLEVDILVNNAGLALGVAPAEANSMAHMHRSTVKVRSLQCPSSAPALAWLEAPRARGRATGRPATALGARSSRHQSHRFYCLSPVRQQMMATLN